VTARGRGPTEDGDPSPREMSPSAHARASRRATLSCQLMDAATYNLICEQVDVLSRDVLEETVAEAERYLGLLETSPPTFESRISIVTRRERETLVAELKAILRGQPIPKPSQHQGRPATHHFRVGLSCEQIDEIVGWLSGAEAAAVSSDGETTPVASRLASLVDVWGTVLERLDGRRDAK